MMRLDTEETKTPMESYTYNVNTSGLLSKSSGAYPLLMNLSATSEQFISGLSNHSMLLMDTEKLKPISILPEAHTARINDIHLTDNISFSASNDGCITAWDTRKSEALHKFKAPPGKEIYSVSNVKEILAAGSNKQIYFWDIKTMKKLNTFTDSHGDDVTRLSFHPEKNNILISGSEDGCVCSFDLRQGNEDDALEAVVNVEQPVITCDFLSGDSNFVHLTTGVNTLKIISLGDAKELLNHNTIDNIDTNTKYLIHAYSFLKDPRLYYLCGNTNTGVIEEISIDWNLTGSKVADKVRQFHPLHLGVVTSARKIREDLLLSASEDGSFKISQQQIKSNPNMIDIEEMSKDLFMDEEIPDTKPKKKRDFMDSFKPY